MDYIYSGSILVKPNPARQGEFIVTLRIQHEEDDLLQFFTIAPHPTTGALSLQPLAEECVQRDMEETVVQLTPDYGERMILVLSGRDFDAITRTRVSYLICDGEVIDMPCMLDVVSLVGAKILLENGQQLIRGGPTKQY